MRAADVTELAALGEDNPLRGIARSVMRSSAYWAFGDHEPIAVFGVAPLSLLGGTGIPWLLGTGRLFRFPGALVREGHRYVERMLALFPHLENHVDARNEASIRWLAHIGFKVHPAAPYGPAKLPFHKFEMRA